MSITRTASLAKRTTPVIHVNLHLTLCSVALNSWIGKSVSICTHVKLLPDLILMVVNYIFGWFRGGQEAIR